MIGKFEMDSGGDMITVFVEDYERAEPMRITGWGFGDAEPGCDEYIEYRVEFDGEVYKPMRMEAAEIENKIREFMGAQ